MRGRLRRNDERSLSFHDRIGTSWRERRHGGVVVAGITFFLFSGISGPS